VILTYAVLAGPTKIQMSDLSVLTFYKGKQALSQYDKPRFQIQCDWGACGSYDMIVCRNSFVKQPLIKPKGRWYCYDGMNQIKKTSSQL
jgi:hypothetical protein